MGDDTTWDGKPPREIYRLDFEVNWAASEMELRGQLSAVNDVKWFHTLEEEVVLGSGPSWLR
jgi:hypothetical protein